MKYSFIVITDNEEPEKLNRLIASIQAQKMDCEVLVSMDKDKTGRLGLLRNKGCCQAQGDIFIVLDDDMILHDDFAGGIERLGDVWEVMSVRILNPDYTRYWDWKGHENGMNWLMDYGDNDPRVSLTGGFCILRRKVFDVVQWDETRGFYQEEDVDFTKRLKQAGFFPVMNPYATVTHDGPYTQRGRGVFRTD